MVVFGGLLKIPQSTVKASVLSRRIQVDVHLGVTKGRVTATTIYRASFDTDSRDFRNQFNSMMLVHKLRFIHKPAISEIIFVVLLTRVRLYVWRIRLLQKRQTARLRSTSVRLEARQ